MLKKIKSSKRGLTFSLDYNEVSIGSRYRYVVDMASQTVNIIFDADGTHKVSKKKVGNHLKPLFDIRSEKVKNLVSEADFLEIEVLEEQIIVYTRKNKKKLVQSKIVRLDEILGRRTGKIVVPLFMVSGAENYQYTLDDWFQSIYSSSNHTISTEDRTQIINNGKRIYDIVSLFSGAGLFDKAWLDDGRFRFVYACDFAKEVIETYEYNIGKHIVCKDIRTVKISEIPDADVTIGGPCCQAYSNANRHNMNTSEAEEKRLLIEDYARLTKTNVFVIENVPQLLTKEQGLYFDKLCSMLSDYEITSAVVTDSEVGGFSKRRRAIIIGSKIGKIELPQMKVITPKTVREALSKVDATWSNFEDVTKPSKETEIKMSFVPQGGNWKDIPAEYNSYGPNTQSNIMRRLKEDEPSITLSNFRKSNILHPNENRILTVSEAAAIMGLEKDFKFFGQLSAKQQMVSNGVTQAIGKLVKNTVLNALDKHYSLCGI